MCLFEVTFWQGDVCEAEQPGRATVCGLIAAHSVCFQHVTGYTGSPWFFFMAKQLRSSILYMHYSVVSRVYDTILSPLS